MILGAAEILVLALLIGVPLLLLRAGFRFGQVPGWGRPVALTLMVLGAILFFKGNWILGPIALLLGAFLWFRR